GHRCSIHSVGFEELKACFSFIFLAHRDPGICHYDICVIQGHIGICGYLNRTTGLLCPLLCLFDDAGPGQISFSASNPYVHTSCSPTTKAWLGPVVVCLT